LAVKLLARSRTLLNTFVRDKQGQVVVWQTPNFPLVGWFVCAAIMRLFDNSRLDNGLSFLSSTLLFTWAYLEIKEGASTFRRFLGIIVILATVLAKFR
jgi:hypothetical protein